MKLWVVRATTTVLLWTCVVQLTAVGDTWGPRVLKGWPSCLTAPEEEAAAALPGAAAARPQPVVEKAALPPKSESPRIASSRLLWLLPRFRSHCSDLLPCGWTMRVPAGHRQPACIVVDPSKAPADNSSALHENDW
jgi:hypothetical protein